MSDQLQPGIYFGLPAEIYHADRALSRSDLVNILDTPRTYWDQSWMNPKRKTKEQTDPMKYGDAFHCALFEPKEFEKRFRIIGMDMWTDGDRRKTIQADEYFTIAESIKVLREGKDSNLFLTAGKSEVTIVFDCEETGLRYRARHDYLTPVCTADFKTTHALDDWALKRAFSRYGLDIQMALYKRSRDRIKQQLRAGTASIFGEVSKNFMKQFMDSEINEFIFIFQRKTEPYPYEPLFPEDDTEDSGRNKIYEAAALYGKYLKTYGTKGRWPACDGKTKSFSMYYGIRREN